MTPRYLSVCSGIEAASAAWHPLGWEPVAFAETEAFPAAVLEHHYPHVPNWGDITRFREWPDAAVDVLVGGTPCQSFSVAGLRGGMADPRGNLALVYLAIADRYRPQWLVWENVPGVLSSDGGRDFGAFVGGLAELGYHAAWRVLDAQYVRVDGFARAVPQRRRRVFVVGHSSDWRRASAVLFERESLQGHPAPRRQAGKGASVPVAPCLRAGGNETGGDRPYGTDVDTCDSLIAHMLKADGFDGGLITAPAVANPLTHRMHKGVNTTMDERQTIMVAHALKADGFDASEDGTGRGTPLVPIAFDITGTEPGTINGANETDVHSVLRSRMPGQSEGSTTTVVATNWAVRRLTPLECERLQGFPDGYTAVPYRGKPAADGPRYKALGNSMAVNCMRWLGRRIEAVDAI